MGPKHKLNNEEKPKLQPPLPGHPQATLSRAGAAEAQRFCAKALSLAFQKPEPDPSSVFQTLVCSALPALSPGDSPQDQVL